MQPITAASIVPDDGVEPPVPKRGRQKDPEVEAVVKKFLSLKPGKQSFFVEGAKRADLEFLRKRALAAGAGIRIIEINQDEIFGVAGTRVWREAGEYDEL